jgi:hypothetical protein
MNPFPDTTLGDKLQIPDLPALFQQAFYAVSRFQGRTHARFERIFYFANGRFANRLHGDGGFSRNLQQAWQGHPPQQFFELFLYEVTDALVFVDADEPGNIRIMHPA